MNQSPMYRKPTEAQRKRIEEARKMTRAGIEDQRGIMSRLMPTMAKSARDDERIGRRMMEQIPESVRRYEAEEGAPPAGPYRKGGKVKSYAKGGKIDGCAQRGKTKGRYI